MSVSHKIQLYLNEKDALPALEFYGVARGVLYLPSVSDPVNTKTWLGCVPVMYMAFQLKSRIAGCCRYHYIGTLSKDVVVQALSKRG
jgi:hypothetical protein